MKFQKYILILVLLCSGCVSVNLGPGKAKKSEGISLQAPHEPFSPIDSQHADEAWQSHTTGNTISYFSECQPQNDPTIESMATDSLSALAPTTVMKEEKLNFNQREALRSSAKGQVDGIEVQLEVLVFKKNGCNYTLTYSGIAKNFPLEINAFENFLLNFKAP